ncbi:MAG: T9SS type A sorting domain-containing protein [Candidatus Zixiibacteriota bacterium]
MKRVVLLILLLSASSYAELFFTSVECEEIGGNIAIKITAPPLGGERYDTGAPIIIAVPGGWDAGGWTNMPEELPEEGVCIISFLLPGVTVDEYSTDGDYDTRGENCIEALKQVILFATGEMEDIHGNTINEFIELTDIDSEKVGLFGGSNGGNLIMATLSLRGEELAGLVDFVLTYESPTSPQINVLDLGYGDPFDDVDGDGNGIFDDDYKNPWYIEYGDTSCIVDLRKICYQRDTTIGLDFVFLDGNEDGIYNQVFRSGHRTADVNNNGVLDTTEDFLFSSLLSLEDSLLYYSTEVTEALWGYLGEEDYPENFANPSQAHDFWFIRSSVYHYDNLPLYHPNLKLMSVFKKRDHAQVVDDKVNIRHGYDGFRRNGLWARLNPDLQYLRHFHPEIETAPDNPANWAPLNWEEDIMDWAAENTFPVNYQILAGTIEMFDRIHYDIWNDPNLSAMIEMRDEVTAPIYTSIIIHSEEPPGTPPYFTDSMRFQISRDALKLFADNLFTRDIYVNWQSDWNFVYAATIFDHGTGLGGLNIAQYLQDSLEASIDPHGHQTVYNYADVAYFLEMLDVEITNIVGGLVAYPPEECIYDRFTEPIEADSFPGYVWNPEILWGGSTSGHVDEETLWVSGIWKPSGCEAFLEHDPDAPLPHIGGYKNDFIGLRDQLRRAEMREYDINEIYTQTIFVGQARLNPSYTAEMMREIDNLEEYSKTDKIRWRTLDEIHDIWISEYDSEPNMVWFGIPIDDIEESEISKPADIKVKAYPNPFNGSLEIELQDEGLVQIYDIEGKTIVQKCCKNTYKWQPDEDIQSGMYLLQLDNKIYRVFYIK